MEEPISSPISNGSGDLTVTNQEVGGHDPVYDFDSPLLHGFCLKPFHVSTIKMECVSAGMELILEAKLPR